MLAEQRGGAGSCFVANTLTLKANRPTGQKVASRNAVDHQLERLRDWHSAPMDESGSSMAAAPLTRRGKCETCQLKQPNYGFASEGTRRWCSGCAKLHNGPEPTVDLTNKRCEDCSLKVATAGVLGGDDGKTKTKKWCGTCAKAHPGAINFFSPPVCEDCRYPHTPSPLAAAARADDSCSCMMRTPRGHGHVTTC